MKSYSLALIFLATVACGQTKPCPNNQTWSQFAGMCVTTYRAVPVLPDPSPKQLLIAPMGLQDGDICIVHDNVCTKVEGGHAAIDWSKAVGDNTIRTPPKPELMDVPAVKIETEPLSMTAYRCGIGGGSWCTPIQEGPPYKYTCTDKRRILLTDEGGGKHCVAFPKESK